MSTSKSASATLVLPSRFAETFGRDVAPIFALLTDVSTPGSAHAVGSRQGTLVGMGLFDRFRRGSRPRMRRPAGDAARTGSTRVRASDRADEQHLADFVAQRARRRGLRRAAHRGQRRDPAAGRPRRRVDPAPGAVGGLGAHVLQPATRCRRTTPRWSASRSGCATTSAARSCRATARRVSDGVQRPPSGRSRPGVVDGREAGAARGHVAARRRRS